MCVCGPPHTSGIGPSYYPTTLPFHHLPPPTLHTPFPFTTTPHQLGHHRTPVDDEWSGMMDSGGGELISHTYSHLPLHLPPRFLHTTHCTTLLPTLIYTCPTTTTPPHHTTYFTFYRSLLDPRLLAIPIDPKIPANVCGQCVAQ